jgi:hypothetical protein
MMMALLLLTPFLTSPHHGRRRNEAPTAPID